MLAEYSQSEGLPAPRAAYAFCHNGLREARNSPIWDSGKVFRQKLGHDHGAIKGRTMSEDRKTVHTFQKNALEEVRASISRFRGKEYIDLRVYYKADDGEYRPSKKGVTLVPELLKELEEAVRKLRKALGPD